MDVSLDFQFQFFGMFRNKSMFLIIRLEQLEFPKKTEISKNFSRLTRVMQTIQRNFNVKKTLHEKSPETDQTCGKIKRPKK